ncbi:DUF2637 domain-containing protein [Micromonospora sp. RTP1Z1]|uniref:DUF2637 domain-containing protein n=1 Tax=Micromonospora sp. RTP1Z1 TaxID=2994043 RepID=UPI0029C726D3|nr:DUF2637 domain-containing protein [Micromonospora sp. RTP1Z1]
MTPTRVARNISTGAVASIAAWSSWSHMVDVALKFGERPEVAFVLPISVDGMLIVASTAMVEDKRAARPVRWSARIAFAAGVAASVGANIAAAHPTLGARIVAAWPAVALLLVVEMLSRARPAVDPPRLGRTGGESNDGLKQPRSAKPPGAVLASRVPSPVAVTDHAAGSDGKASPGTSRQTRRDRRSEQTADLVARVQAERPSASLAEIAKAAGVSERHVRRLLASGKAGAATPVL